MTPRLLPLALVVVMTALVTRGAEAQSLGTFTWQLQPFCNVVTVNVIQQGGVYTLDGYDNQCGAARRAPLVGLATPNPDGSIGLGFQLVTVPGGRGLQVDARITLPSASGAWTDSAGNTGTLALGASTGGSARPLPSAPTTIPGTFALLPNGAFLARGTGAAGGIPASGPGIRMMWHPGKAAFRAGNVGGSQWDEANIGVASTAMGAGTTASGAYGVALGFGTTAAGDYSVATGARTMASGVYSTAMGADTVASGSVSTAMGASAVASGTDSTAMGGSTTASGTNSTAMGDSTTASGPDSTAMGSGTVASGAYSTAMGQMTRASGESSTAMGAVTIAGGRFSVAMGSGSSVSGDNSTAIGTALSAAGGASLVLGVRAATTPTGNGSFVYGDQSTGQSGSVLTSSAPNQFLVRASGGVTLYTNGALTSGVTLAGGGSGWGVVSDVRMKEHFRDVVDDEILAAIAALPVRTWNYTTQDAAIRHIGPTAQDFYAAFGLGESDIRINTIDADGVALAAAKALEARTRALPDDVGALRQQVADLTRSNDELRARLARLETLLERR